MREHPETFCVQILAWKNDLGASSFFCCQGLCFQRRKRERARKAAMIGDFCMAERFGSFSVFARGLSRAASCVPAMTSSLDLQDATIVGLYSV
jgi:hypothetical protein